MDFDRLKAVKAFLLDMDGTFYLSDQIYPYSLDFMDFLRERDMDYTFLTNNSTKNASYYVEKLGRMGFHTTTDKILTSGEATARYIRNINPAARIYLLGTPILEEEFRSYGFTLTDQNPDFVIIGFDTTLTYNKLWKACDFIRLGVDYVATHPDFNCPIDSETGFMPDIGGIIAFIDATTGHRPKVIGKPNAEIVQVALEKLGLEAHQVAVVGDRLYTDIATGINAGMVSILVMSGETTEEMLANSEIQPDYVFKDLGEIQKYMMNME